MSNLDKLTETKHSKILADIEGLSTFVEPEFDEVSSKEFMSFLR
jgi:hypothetical protein